MRHEVEISLAESKDYENVGIFVWMLLQELFPEYAESFEKQHFIASARTLLGTKDRVWALLGKVKGQQVAILTLNECAAIYAGGLFGEISEFYVLPKYRSGHIGKKMIAAADAFAITRDWSALEVCLANMPASQRTQNFYVSNGFSLLGPRLDRKVSTL
jgi:GNAT superfamily N-acetyltransferase